MLAEADAGIGQALGGLEMVGGEPDDRHAARIGKGKPHRCDPEGCEEGGPEQNHDRQEGLGIV